MMARPQKITFGEMRASGVRDVLIYCRDHRCSHPQHVPLRTAEVFLWANERPDPADPSLIQIKCTLKYVRSLQDGALPCATNAKS